MRQSGSDKDTTVSLYAQIDALYKNVVSSTTDDSLSPTQPGQTIVASPKQSDPRQVKNLELTETTPEENLVIISDTNSRSTGEKEHTQTVAKKVIDALSGPSSQIETITPSKTVQLIGIIPIQSDGKKLVQPPQSQPAIVNVPSVPATPRTEQHAIPSNHSVVRSHSRLPASLLGEVQAQITKSRSEVLAIQNRVERDVHQRLGRAYKLPSIQPIPQRVHSPTFARFNHGLVCMPQLRPEPTPNITIVNNYYGNSGRRGNYRGNYRRQQREHNPVQLTPQQTDPNFMSRGQKKRFFKRQQQQGKNFKDWVLSKITCALNKTKLYFFFVGFTFVKMGFKPQLISN